MPYQGRKNKSLKKITNFLKVFKVSSLKRKTKMTMLDVEEAVVSYRDVEDSIAEEKRKHKKSLARLFREQRKEKAVFRQTSEQELVEVNKACNNLRREIEEDAVRNDVLDRLQDEIVAMKEMIKKQQFRIRELQLEKRRLDVMNSIQIASIEVVDSGNMDIHVIQRASSLPYFEAVVEELDDDEFIF